MSESKSQLEKKSALCHVCGADALKVVPGYETFRRVTSDCKPWPAGGCLCVCGACGTAQKSVDESWRAEAASIYENYEVYHQSGGVEQAVFSAQGAAAARSVRVVEALLKQASPPPQGRLLDIGCGNGALLRAFRDAVPGWTLAGLELDDTNRAAVESIPGVEALYTGGPADAPGAFDIITMIHALEHIPDPLPYLESIRQKLNPGGLLALEQPHYLENPFELLIADHCTHFSTGTLRNLLNAAGFETIFLSTDWVAKEITTIAQKTEDAKQTESVNSTQLFNSLTACLKWLDAVRTAARDAANAGPIGIFGTSIAATWLFSELEGRAVFFVDEDPARSSREFMGRQIYAPADAPSGGRVFVPLPHSLADSIIPRLERAGLSPIEPPIFNAPCI